MRHKRWIALAVLPALLLAGDFFYWRLAVSQLRAGFEAWTAQVQATGWVVRHGPVVSGGWPDAAMLRVVNLTISTSDMFGRGGLSIGTWHLAGATWGADTVLLSTGLTRPDTLEVTPIGLHPLQLDDRPPVPVSAEHLRLRLTSRLKATSRVVDIDADTLTASVPRQGVVSVGRLSLHADLKPDASRDQAAVTFSVSARPVALPERIHFALGLEIAELALDGVLNGPFPSDDGQSPAARAARWRDDGGSLELRRLVIDWGKARLDATATLALDEDLQPMGAGTGRIAGYAEALDALAANAVLSRSAVQAAKAVLDLLADTPTDDQPAEVEVPLTLQFRTLSVRQVPLARLPELDWPEH